MISKESFKPKENKIKILVVDDHPIVRQGLAQIINQEDDMILAGEAGDSNEALQTLKKIKPDLVIVDISLKGTSGLELSKSIIASYPKIPILIISMYDESLYVERVLRIGAKGYLMKQEAIDNVVGAIRKVLSGETYVSEKMRDNLVHKFINGSTTSGVACPESLSDRELEVMQLIGQGRPTRQIAEELCVSVKTIESHYANIKNKLNLKSAHELIQYAVKWYLSEK
jgi:DNA-binding NarL/FixJ family response regulator